ncbi:MAG: hypothetical protein ACJAZS_000162 [Alteromonas naphthalenivorans]|jgi:hypothetical protein
MLPGRTVALKSVCWMYKTFGTFLVVQSGNKFSELVSYDDAGLFLYIPYLSYFLNIKSLNAEILFIQIVAFVFLIISFWGVSLCSSTLKGSLFASVLLILCSYKISMMRDVYIGYIIPFIPIMLFFGALEKRNKVYFMISSFLVGLLGFVGSLIRSFASWPVFILFFLIGCFSPRFNKKEKFGALLFFLIGYGIPYVHYQWALSQQKSFLQSYGVVSSQNYQHIFWHNIYISFGFLQNSHGITWEDGCNDRAIKKINPKLGVGGLEGEEITKNMIINLFQKDRHFVLTSLFARFGIVMMFFLIWFGWVGLICAYLVPKSWYYELAFLLAFGCSAAPGVLTIPCFEYLAGFIVCVVIYTVLSFIIACNNGIETKIKYVRKGYTSE